MTPFIFKLEVSIPAKCGDVNKEFIFIDRSEAEKFRLNLKPLGAVVKEVVGFIPSNCDTAMRRVADVIKESYEQV